MPLLPPLFSPLDEELGLLPGELTPSLVEDAVRLGVNAPFGQAATLLKHFRQVVVSEATVRRLTERGGATEVTLQREEVEELERKAPASPQGPPLQQVSVDGAMVPLLHEEWGEAKTLAIGKVVAESEGEVHAEELSYFSRMTDHQSFSRLATVETHRRGTSNAQRVCAVVDGAEWEQEFITFHRWDAVRILDFAHAAGYVAQAGQAVFGVGTAETSEWIGEQLHELKHGKPRHVLDAMRRLKELARDEEALASVTQGLEYLEKRREQVQYALFRSLGYPIGSGIVESANKLVVEARLKGAGMHWRREHVNPMLALRTLECSERWEEDWPLVRQRLSTQHKERGRVRRARRMSISGSTEQPAKATPPPRTSTTTTRTAPRGPAAVTKTPGKPSPDHIWRRMTLGKTTQPHHPHLPKM